MHMADALISPQVGGIMWIASGALVVHAVRRLDNHLDEKKVPLMGVMGAFIFAAQMINFAIPATGSSGHIGGGLILAALLGPYAAFLTKASILTIQALLFGDGGLLALGCNIFNMGFYTCFIVYPLLYKRVLQRRRWTNGFYGMTIFSAVLGLQLGALSVVMETWFSNKTALPFATFAMLMLPIHLAIGLVEGAVTIAVLKYIHYARPQMITSRNDGWAFSGRAKSRALLVLCVVAAFTGGTMSWFASSRPDGLEWSIFKITGHEKMTDGGASHQLFAALQHRLALLPDYGFKAEASGAGEGAAAAKAWPDVDAGRSLSGLLGGVLTLALASGVGLIIRKWTLAKRV